MTTLEKSDDQADAPARPDLKALEAAIEQSDQPTVERLLLEDRLDWTGLSARLHKKVLNGAIVAGNVELARALTSRPMPADGAVECNALSPLWLAVFSDLLDVAEMIVRAGGDVNERLGRHALYDAETSILHMIALQPRRRERRFVQLLLEHGDVDACDSSGESVLHYAVKFADVELVKLLLEHGARIEQTNRAGETPLHIAMRNCFNGELFRVMRKYDPNIYAIDMNGKNVLHHLAQSAKENCELTEYLIAKGLSPTEKELKHNRAPIHLAAMTGKVNMVKLLIDHGADVNEPSECGKTPLHFAAKSDNPLTLALLIQKGAKVDARSDQGLTPLHIACKDKQEQNIRVLCSHGADVQALDKLGNTPMSLVEFKNLSPAMKAVLRHLCLDPRNLHPTDLETLNTYPLLMNYYTACKAEVDLMRKDTFFEDISVLAVLVKKSEKKLAALTKNADFVEAFHNHDVRGKYPTYAAIVETKFNKAYTKQKILDELECNLQVLFGEYLPVPVINKLATYVNPVDLGWLTLGETDVVAYSKDVLKENEVRS